MKKLLTLSIIALFAANASAQIITPMGRPDRNGIIYSMNPIPPIVSNNHIAFSPGSPYVDASGTYRACSAPLVVDYANGAGAHAVCKDKPAVTASAADALANLAPAAGGPHALTDRNLSSDSNSGLRNDRGLISNQ